MIFKLLNSIFGSKNDRFLKKYTKLLHLVNSFESEFTLLSDLKLKEKFFYIKDNFHNMDFFNFVLPNVYAIVREASNRVLGLRHYDVQILAGIALYDNKIIEVSTGEGKTLIATLPVCLWSLFNKPIHVITVNDYLAKRDAAWMSPIYYFFDISVGVVFSGMTIIERKKAYSSSVTYGTCSEFGFDYLRDNIVTNYLDKVQSELNYVILDEVDSILIDEARTPLIISSSSKFDSSLFISINKIALKLNLFSDFVLDEKNKQINLTDLGFSKLEDIFFKEGLLKQRASLYDVNNINLLHYLYSALKAIYFFKKDVDYIVKDDNVLIIDENTGRILDGRRWSDGLHQSVEAKEKVSIKNENQVLASITFQNYFRLYNFISGMTGTAYTEREEFNSIYGLDVLIIPTNKSCIRLDHPDLIFIKKKFKIDNIIIDIKNCYKIGQPILVGTVSIVVSEFISEILYKNNIKHNVLNAKNHEKEAQIIADAGKFKSVTIATNMAGRGTDIVLGGKKSNLEEYELIVKLGGLKVIGTERHESRRIDNQLRGRCGRQGDPGTTQFYVSLEDDLIRIFIGDNISGILSKLNISDSDVISNKLITKSIENAQKKVESRNFDIRKQLLEFDDIFNEQRIVFYSYRNFVMYSKNMTLIFDESFYNDIFVYFLIKFGLSLNCNDFSNLIDSFKFEFGVTVDLVFNYSFDIFYYKNFFIEKLIFLYQKRIDFFNSEKFNDFEKVFFLNVLDMNWKDHLINLDHLKKGIHLRGYAQQDPKQEYKKEAFSLFENMILSSKYEFFLLLLKMPLSNLENIDSFFLLNGKNIDLIKDVFIFNESFKLGRNSLCFCRSFKKYKYCHGFFYD